MVIVSFEKKFMSQRLFETLSSDLNGSETENAWLCAAPVVKKAKEAATPVAKTPKKEVAKTARKEEITPKEKNAKTPSDKVSWVLSEFQSALSATESAVTFSVNECYLLDLSPIQW